MERNGNTANWSGYTGYWEIVYGQLYLKKVVVYVYDELLKTEWDITYDANDLKELFAPYYTAHGISAEWYSRKTVTMGRGECIRVNHDAQGISMGDILYSWKIYNQLWGPTVHTPDRKA